MYMRNLFLLPFVALVLVFDLKRGMTNLLKMGWGGKESITVVFLFIMLSVNNRKRGTRIDDNMGSGCIL